MGRTGRERSLRAFLIVTSALLLLACSKQGYDKLEPPGDLVISRVVCEADRVVPGQRLITVQVRCENFDPYPITIDELNLRMSAGASDRAGDFVILPPELPVELPPGQGATLAFSLEVRADASSGLVELDACGGATRWDESCTEAEQAREGDSFEVVDLPGLTVSTSADEDDMGAVPSLEAAGGVLDLSLREAVRIANTSGQASVIRFDPAVFPENSPVSIRLSAALGSLEPITQAGTVIDGGGAGVAVNGSQLESDLPWQVQADQVRLQSFDLHEFDACEAVGALEVIDSDGLQLVDMRFVANGRDDGANAQARIWGGQGHLVAGCLFTSGLRDGLAFNEDPSGVQIIDSQFISNGDEGLSLWGSEHEVRNCSFLYNGGGGLSSYDRLINTRIEDCEFTGNGGAMDEVGLHFEGQAALVQVSDCRFEANARWGIRILGAAASSVSIQECRFSADHVKAIELSEGSNEGIEAPSISMLAGDQLQGTSPPNAIVEVYSAGPWLEPIAETQSDDGGNWTLTLPKEAGRLIALATSAMGSTSAFSDPFSNTPLIVSTSEDELDGGPDILSVEQAGGAADLSFREALTIAANGYGADTISFDATVFPAGQETVIQLRQTPDLPDELPLVSHQLVIDGRGTGEVIDGGGLSFPANSGILRLEDANNSQVLELAMRSFDSRDGACIMNHGSDQLIISGCEFVACGEIGSGAAIRSYEWANDNLIENNVIRGSYRGISTDVASGMTVRGNHFDRMRNVAIFLYNTDDASIVDNLFTEGDSTAVHIDYSCEYNMILGNRLWNNENNGVFVGRYSFHNDIWFNSMVGNGSGIELDDESGDSNLINNLMTSNAGVGLRVQEGATWEGEHNLYFDNGGDGDTGANAVEGDSLDASSLLADPGLTGLSGGDFTPTGAAVDTGVDVGVDRNGSDPGLFNGAAPDIGAVESP